MADSSGAKEDENVIHKVDIRLGKRPMMEEQINVEEKSVDEHPNNDVVAPEVVEVTPKVDFRIEFTTDRRFEQRADMLKWVRDLSKKLSFVVVTTKSDNGGNGRKDDIALGCQRGGQYWEYSKKKREAMITLKGGCPFKL
jgi:hypothetical protein